MTVDIEAENPLLESTIRRPFAVLSSKEIHQEDGSELTFYEDKFIGILSNHLKDGKNTVEINILGNEAELYVNRYYNESMGISSCSNLLVLKTKFVVVCWAAKNRQELIVFIQSINQQVMEKRTSIMIPDEYHTLKISTSFSHSNNDEGIERLVIFLSDPKEEISSKAYLLGLELLGKSIVMKEINLNELGLEFLSQIIPINNLNSKGHSYNFMLLGKRGNKREGVILKKCSFQSFNQLTCSSLEGEDNKERERNRFIGLNNNNELYAYQINYEVNMLILLFYPIAEVMDDTFRRRITTRIEHEDLNLYSVQDLVINRGLIGLLLSLKDDYNGIEKKENFLIFMIDINTKIYTIEKFDGEKLKITIGGAGFITWIDSTIQFRPNPYGFITLNALLLEADKGNLNYRVSDNMVLPFKYQRTSYNSEIFKYDFENDAILFWISENDEVQFPVSPKDLVSYKTITRYSSSSHNIRFKESKSSMRLLLNELRYENIIDLKSSSNMILIITENRESINKYWLYDVGEIASSEFFDEYRKTPVLITKGDIPSQYLVHSFKNIGDLSTIILRNEKKTEYAFYFIYSPSYIPNKRIIKSSLPDAIIMDAIWLQGMGDSGTIIYIEKGSLFQLQLSAKFPNLEQLNFTKLQSIDLAILSFDPFMLAENPLKSNLVYIIDRVIQKNTLIIRGYYFEERLIKIVDSTNYLNAYKGEDEFVKYCSFGQYFLMVPSRYEFFFSEIQLFKSYLNPIYPEIYSYISAKLGQLRMGTICDEENQLAMLSYGSTVNSTSRFYIYDTTAISEGARSLLKIVESRSSYSNTKIALLKNAVVLIEKLDTGYVFSLQNLRPPPPIFVPSTQVDYEDSHVTFHYDTIYSGEGSIPVKSKLYIVGEPTFNKSLNLIEKIEVNKTRALWDILALNFSIFNIDTTTDAEAKKLIEFQAPFNKTGDVVKDLHFSKQPTAMKIRDGYLFGIIGDDTIKETVLAWQPVFSRSPSKSFLISIKDNNCNKIDVEFEDEKYAVVALACKGILGSQIMIIWLQIDNSDSYIIEKFKASSDAEISISVLKGVVNRRDRRYGRTKQYSTLSYCKTSKQLHVNKVYTQFDANDFELKNMYVDPVTSYPNGSSCN